MPSLVFQVILGELDQSVELSTKEYLHIYYCNIILGELDQSVELSTKEYLHIYYCNIRRIRRKHRG